MSFYIQRDEKIVPGPQRAANNLIGKAGRAYKNMATGVINRHPGVMAIRKGAEALSNSRIGRDFTEQKNAREAYAAKQEADRKMMQDEGQQLAQAAASNTAKPSAPSAPRPTSPASPASPTSAPSVPAQQSQPQPQRSPQAVTEQRGNGITRTVKDGVETFSLKQDDGGYATMSSRLDQQDSEPAGPARYPRANGAGQLQVAFDDSVTPEQREAFMRRPVRGSRQVVMRDNSRETYGPRETRRPSPGESLNFDTIGDMIVSGQKLRAAKGIEDIQSSQAKTQAAQDTLNLKADEIAAGREDNRQDYEVGQERNRLYGESVASQSRANEASAAASEAGARQDNMIADLQQQIINEKDPARKKELINTLNGVMSKFEPREAQDRTAMTEYQRLQTLDAARKRFDTYMTMNPKAGTTFEDWARTNAPEALSLMGQQQGGGDQVQAPAAAMAALRNNPALKDQFMQKYGYLPEGY